MILVLGGTSDSLLICEALSLAGAAYKISVTTAYGESLSLKYTQHVIAKALNLEEMMVLIRQEEIDTIIDATHPYAVEVSKIAMQVAENLKLRYVRYERKSLLEEGAYEKLYRVESIEEAAILARRIGNNIFLGTGSKNLDKFWNLLEGKKLFARVLPTSQVLRLCEEIGFEADQIIAMKGPFSTEVNEVLFKSYSIDLVITKESGKEGGFLEKIEACKHLEIPVIVIQRETIDYPCMVNEISDVLENLI